MTSPALADLLERLRTLSEVVEDVLVHEAPDGRAIWAATLLEALEHVNRACDPQADAERRVELVDAALVAIAKTRQAPESPSGLAAAIDEVLAYGAEVRGRAVDVAAFVVGDAATGEPEAPPFQASVGSPRVHARVELPAPDILPQEVTFDPEADVKRALAATSVGLETLRRWLTSEEDDDEPDDPAPIDDAMFAGPRGTPLEVVQLRRIAKDTLEDIAILGSLRRHEPELPWDFAEHFEDRLLGNLDALVALDRPRAPDGARLGVARELWAYLREWQAPDPGRAFAFAFVLACSDQEAGPRWVGVTLRRAHGRLARSLEDAIALGCSPHWPAVLAGLLQSETNPGRLRVALRAWNRHGRVDAAAVIPLLAHPDPSVVQAAIACVARERGDIAVPALAELVGSEPEVAAEAALGLARLGERQGLQHLRAVLIAPGEDESLERARAVAARAIAVLGDTRDSDDLLACCARRPDLAELLGWHGQRAHVPVLLAALQRAEDDGQRKAAAWGLTRILGTPPDAAPGSGPVLDTQVWQRAIAAADPGAGKRWQLGQAVSSGSASVRRLADELRASGTRQRDRGHALLELELALGRPLPIDLEGWVVVQREILAAAAI